MTENKKDRMKISSGEGPQRDESRMDGLVIAVLNGEATSEEEGELRAWLEESEEHVQLFDRMRRVVESTRVQDEEAPIFDVERGWDSVRGVLEGNGKVRRRRSFWMYRVAAAAVVVLFFTMGWWASREKVVEEKVDVADLLPGSTRATLFLDDGSMIAVGSEKLSISKDGAVIRNDSLQGLSFQCVNPTEGMKYNRLVVPKAGEYKLTLPDGTKVWVNSESQLRFPSCFAEDRREVELVGEAYFEVVHDEKKPFLVSTGDVTVKVYGTKFNVNAYSDADRVEATLLDGSVSMTPRGGVKEVFIRPNQQLIYSRSTKDSRVQEVDASLFMAWKDGVYAFDNARLEDMMIYLSRWYAFEVEYEDDGLKELVFTGEIEKDKPLHFGLQLIRLTCEVNFDVDGNKIKVTK